MDLAEQYSRVIDELRRRLEQADKDKPALDRIAEMLRDPEWAPGMLEDIADHVRATGRSIQDTYKCEYCGAALTHPEPEADWVDENGSARCPADPEYDDPDPAFHEPEAVSTWERH